MLKHKVPPALVINFDQTGLRLLPTAKVSRAPVGAKEVALVGASDMRQITGVLGASLDGKILPPQLIFQGKTERSLPSPSVRKDKKFEGWDFTQTENHWSNLEASKRFMDMVVEPYFALRKRELGLPEGQVCIVMLDCWSVHRGQPFRDWMEGNHGNIKLCYIPGGCTGKAQLMDVAFNRPVKSSMAAAVAAFLADQVAEQVAKGVKPEEVKFDTGLGLLRDALPGWLHGALTAMDARAIEAGMQAIGLPRIFTPQLQLEALQAQLRGDIFPNSEGGEAGAAEAEEEHEEEHEEASTLDLYDSDDDLPINEVMRRAVQRGEQQAAALQSGEGTVEAEGPLTLQGLVEEMMGGQLNE